MDFSWYSELLVRRYWLIIAIIFLISISCITVPLATGDLPKFNEPQAGFEARGTELAQRLRTWENLRDTNTMTNNPLEYYYFLQDSEKNQEQEGEQEQIPEYSRPKHQRFKPRPNHKKPSELNQFADDTETEENPKKNEEKPPKKEEEPGFFCNAPLPDYARVVVGSTNDELDVWSIDGMKALCNFDRLLRTSNHFESMCQMKDTEANVCCRTWSPANYVTFMMNRKSCDDITEEDLYQVKKILLACNRYYRIGQLGPGCSENMNCKVRVPLSCYLHGDAVYNMLNYLLDDRFLKNVKNRTEKRLPSAMMLLPVAASTTLLDYYLELSNEIYKSDRGFKIVAMELGLKNEVFDRLLISDSYLLIIGFTFVTICIWAYTDSFIITLSTIFVVVFSLGISFAFYRLVLRIELFPFMNLMAVVVAVGIGSDDAFIFCKVWEYTKKQGPADPTLVRFTRETLKHAVPAMLVSTLTTAIAFFASYVSNVTAINCFSLFSGITVIVNFLLMISWLPACVIAAERFSFEPPNFINRTVTRPIRHLQLLFDISAQIFRKVITRIVISLRWMWLFNFSALTICALIIVFYRPGLQLPSTPNFQLLSSHHPFEVYEVYYSRYFHFEQRRPDIVEQVMPMRFIWGVMPVDNGEQLNPASRGTLVLDPNFNISTPEAQLWLQHFCEQLRVQPFYRSTLGPLLPNCFIESMQPWMNRSCQDPVEIKMNRAPCCESSTFPYEPRTLRDCAAEAVAKMYRTPSHLWNYVPFYRITAGFKFQKLNETREKIVPEIQALVVEYDSNVAFSFSYAEMEKFYHTVEKWMQRQLKSAPKGLRNGWFVSDLQVYELQRTLYEGTLWSIVVSMCLASTIIGLATFNPLIGLYAVLSVAASIVATVAMLVLLGWRLNVLENVTVSTAIGLAVDFSLHYAVSYRRNTVVHPIHRVNDALDRMAGPTFMAALTTAIPGAIMLFSHVLAYTQIGAFLIIVMIVSWGYATFLLCPMLVTCGPSPGLSIYRGRGHRASHAVEEDNEIELEEINNTPPTTPPTEPSTSQL